MTQAKDAAGDRNVLVHGAGIARLALAAGVLDELVRRLPRERGQAVSPSCRSRVRLSSTTASAAASLPSSTRKT